MTDKFEFYDILSILIPGTLLLALMSIGFPALAIRFTAVKFPEAFGVICLVALAVFMGQVVQAISSLIEPLLEWTWGGRASEKALRKGLGTRYLPADTAKRIKQKLAGCVGSAESDRSLFLYAMQRAETSGNSRVAKFNGLYAYHRAMFTLLLIGIVVVLLLIIWRRAKQRGFFYVREVLSTTEQLIDSQQKVAK